MSSRSDQTPRDLRLLAAAVLLSATGDLLALVTLALEVHDLTGSGLAVSAFFAAMMLPAVVLVPVAGVIADRVESVHVLATASLVQALLALALALTVHELGAILVLSALLAAGSAVSQPAEFALVPVVAQAHRLTEANGTMEAARYAGYAAGPALAALVAASAGTQAALLIDAASFLAIAAAAGLIRSRRPPVPSAAGAVRARDGIAYLWRDRAVRTTVVAATAAVLFIAGSLTIEVFYVKDVLRAGDVGYALLTVAWTLGMAAGARGLAARVPRQALPAAALVALGVQGAGMAGQTAWVVLPVALAGYAIGGIGHGVKNTLVRTLIQQRVPEEVHGRAFAAYNAGRNAVELAALGVGGALVSAIGARPALLLAGLGPVIAAGAGLLALRAGPPRRLSTRAPQATRRPVHRAPSPGRRRRRPPMRGAFPPPSRPASPTVASARSAAAPSPESTTPC